MPSDPATQNTPLRLIVQKLTPRLLIGFLSFAILMLAAAIQFTVLSGGGDSLQHFKIYTNKDQEHALKKAESELLSLRWELANKEQQIAGLLNKPTQKPLACRDDLELSDDVSRHLFLLEKTIAKYGNSISTALPSTPERQKTYALIQSILKDLGYYQGKVDGQQDSTQAALLRFQRHFNASLQKLGGAYRTQTIEHLGTLGYKTLEAMRSTHRQQKLNLAI